MFSNKNELMSAFNGLNNLPFIRQIALLIGLAASIALGVYIVMWTIEPNFRPLYSQIDERDSSSILDVLQNANIPYKVNKNNGEILVPANKVYDARMKLASEGLPSHESGASNLLDKDGNFVNSQFMESLKYIHALESELSRTIMSMSNVKKARVHLAMPKQATFVDDKRKPSASVLIESYRGNKLSKQQINAIVNLVASSVPELTADHVILVDGQGNLLNEGGGTNELSVIDKRLDYQKDLESTYEKQIEELIIPILGPNKVKARVSVALDFTNLEQTHESFDPDGQVVRSEQSLEENRHDKSSSAEGVPGALSNQPPVATTLLNNKPGQTAETKESTPKDTRKQVTRNFELDKTISYTKNQPGQIKHLSVAVVVDDKTKVDKAGKVQRIPLKPEEITELTKLIKDAVGFNAERGDRVTLINRSFAEPEKEEAIPNPGFFERPWVQDLIKQFFGGIFILFLIFGVLKPLLKMLATYKVDKASNNGGLISNNNGGVVAGQPGMVGEDGSNLEYSSEELKMLGAQQSYDEQMQAVKKMASNDPKRVAHVVKKWVDGEG